MPESPGGADVRIRLVVDDQATVTVAQLREALKGGSDELEKGHGHAEKLGHELLKASLYADLVKEGASLVAEGIHQAWELAERLKDATVEAADEMNQQVRASAGLMSLMDQGAHSMGEVRDYAAGVREELEGAGTQAGVATKQMEEMFDRVIERGNRSTEQARELTEEIALVGKVVPRGMEGLAEGFNMMELGIVRARNPLVQLIASTHTLQGNAHSVAAAMMKMTPAQQIEVANRAIEKQADMLRKNGGALLGQPTMGELRASFGNIREGVLEAVGEPIIEQLTPQLVALRDFLVAHAEEIKEFGSEVGEDVGKIVDAVGAATRGIYEGLVQNWEHARSVFGPVLDDWRNAWEVSVSDTDNIEDKFRGIASTLIDAFATAARYLKAAAEVAMDANDLIHGRSMGTSQAAVQEASVTKLADELGGGSAARLDEAIAKYRDLAAEAGLDQAAVDKWTEAIREHHDAAEREAGAVQEKIESQDFDYVSRYFDQAMKAHNDAAEAFALNVIGESDSATRALMTGAIHIDGGLAALKDVIDTQAPELAKKLKQLGEHIKGDGGIKGQGPQVNFYGAHFTMHNDFRNQDPDRIIQKLKRSIGNEAIARRQSRMAQFAGL